MDTRIARNHEIIKRLRASPRSEIRLQLSDDELRAIHMNPAKCRPNGCWRKGREFHLFTHAKATWAGGGWWDIKAPSRLALDRTLARLMAVWNPAPVQKSLDLPAPDKPLPPREVVQAHLENCRRILAGA